MTLSPAEWAETTKQRWGHGSKLRSSAEPQRGGPLEQGDGVMRRSAGGGGGHCIHFDHSD